MPGVQKLVKFTLRDLLPFHDVHQIDSRLLLMPVQFTDPVDCRSIYDQCICIADRAAGVYKSVAIRDNMDPTQPRDGEHFAFKDTSAAKMTE